MATVALTAEKFDQVEEGLKDVIDPELGVNIVDLGLIMTSPGTTRKTPLSSA